MAAFTRRISRRCEPPSLRHTLSLTPITHIFLNKMLCSRPQFSVLPVLIFCEIPSNLLAPASLGPSSLSLCQHSFPSEALENTCNFSILFPVPPPPASFSFSSSYYRCLIAAFLLFSTPPLFLWLTLPVVLRAQKGFSGARDAAVFFFSTLCSVFTSLLVFLPLPRASACFPLTLPFSSLRVCLLSWMTRAKVTLG